MKDKDTRMLEEAMDKVLKEAGPNYGDLKPTAFDLKYGHGEDPAKYSQENDIENLYAIVNASKNPRAIAYFEALMQLASNNEEELQAYL